MLEIANLMGAGRRRTVKNVTDLTLYVMSPVVINSTGSGESWFGLYYLELLDANGVAITDYSSRVQQVTASSAYPGATYQPAQATVRSATTYWCNSGTANNGNPNKSLWIKIAFNQSIAISGVNAIMVNSYTSRTLLLESTAGISKQVYSPNVPVWPLVSSLGATATARIDL